MSGIWKPFSQPEYKRPWQIMRLVKQIGRDIKWSHQRIWKGYCDYDLFSIDGWFMKIMPQMLKVFRETRHSSPVAVNYHSHAVFLDEKERDQDIHDEWDKKLDRMIFLLGEMTLRSGLCCLRLWGFWSWVDLWGCLASFSMPTLVALQFI